MKTSWRDLAEIVRLNEYIYGIDEQGKVNLFVINGSERALLVDTGSGLLPLPEIIRELCGEKPVVVVNTHAHLDHNLGNNQFAEVFTGRRDAAASCLTVEDLLHDDSVPYMADGVDADLLAGWNPGSSKIVTPLSDGDTISLGDLSFTVMEIPSHTVGSIALFEKEKGWLFTGDVVLPWAGWGWLPESSSLREYYDSVCKLCSIREQVSHIFSSHGNESMRVDGLSRFELPVRALDAYRQGLAAILAGTYTAEDFTYDGMLFGRSTADIPKKQVNFEIGGVIFDPRRIEP